MKILSIGNSFSQDAHKWLHKLAEKNGVCLETANLYIGGCSLERHWNNVLENKADYSLELNGDRGQRYVSILEALDMLEWDVITLQQQSGRSGRPQSYFPYIINLYELIRQKQPRAKIYFYQTWSYEWNSDIRAFELYNNDQLEMFRRIEDTSLAMTKLLDIPMIPVGKVIQTIRETVPEFDYKNGGLSLNRDGFHLTLDYGRFAAAATFYCVLTGNKIRINEFEDFDMDLINKITDKVESVVFSKAEE